MAELIETRYAQRPAGVIAYQVMGSAPSVVLDFGSGTYLSIDDAHDEPRVSRFLARLAAFSTVIRFDPCGIGLSDTPADWDGPSLQQWANDALAVLDAERVQSVVIFANCGATLPALVLATEHPERVQSMILLSGVARLSATDGYPEGLSGSFYERFLPALAPNADLPDDDVSDIRIFAPSLADDPSFKRWWARAARRGATPAVAAQYTTLQHTSDARHLLAGIRIPALVIARRDVQPEGRDAPRYLADHLPVATFVEHPGADVVPYAAGADRLLAEMEEWITGQRSVDRERVVRTIVFTDIADSTRAASTFGDRAWKDLLHNLVELSKLEIARHDGSWVKDMGDGSLSTFPSPRAGISCATALRQLARELGLSIRTGIHTAEVERRDGGDIGGIAVHLAARIAARAAPDQILVSNTVAEIMEGSSLRFVDAGRHDLKGIEHSRQLWELVRADAPA